MWRNQPYKMKEQTLNEILIGFYGSDMHTDIYPDLYPFCGYGYGYHILFEDMDIGYGYVEKFWVNISDPFYTK